MDNQKGLAARLRHERDLIRELLNLAAEQRECLITGKADRLGEIVSQQAALLQRLSRAASKTKASSDDPGPLEGKTTPDSSACLQLRAETAELAEDLRRQGRLNWTLARQAMRYIDFSISLLGGREEEASYSSAGRRQARPSPFLMNKTA